MNVNELRGKSDAQLRDELHALLKEQFNLRMQKAIGQEPRPDQISKARKNIARVKTVMNEKRATVSDAVGEKS